MIFDPKQYNYPKSIMVDEVIFILDFLLLVFATFIFLTFSPVRQFYLMCRVNDTVKYCVSDSHTMQFHTGH